MGTLLLIQQLDKQTEGCQVLDNHQIE